MINRKQRREMERYNKGKVNSNRYSKLLPKPGKFDPYIKECALYIFKEHAIDKMFFCINNNNYSDIAVIKFVESESLMYSLGVLSNITLDSGKVRHNNFIIYVEVINSNTIIVKDGSRVCNL